MTARYINVHFTLLTYLLTYFTRRRGPSSNVSTKFEADSSIRSKVIRVIDLQRRQQYSVGILLNVVDPDVARATRQSSPGGHWLSAVAGDHRQTQSVVCWYSRVQRAMWPNRDNRR